MIGLTILCKSNKVRTQVFYQHYLIHGLYKGWALPGCYSFITGKSYNIYNEMFTNLKEAALAAGLSLNHQTISIDFEQGMIKAVKMHFPNVKITGCHFHFTSAIHNKLVEIGLKTNYDYDEEFRKWTQTFMAFPFLKLSDIDECWAGLLENLPLMNGNNDDLNKLTQFVNYLRDTWVKSPASFPRSIWNFNDYQSHRTNNICETFNKKLNSLISKPKPNIYKLIDLLKDQEVLTSIDYERANLGKTKSRRTKEDLKDKEIEILKLKYKHCEIDWIKFLFESSVYVKQFD